jgi:hypothetical protein
MRSYLTTHRFFGNKIFEEAEWSGKKYQFSSIEIIKIEHCR